MKKNNISSTGQLGGWLALLQQALPPQPKEAEPP
jgi:hypothetical protein